MAYKTEELFEQAKKYINKHELYFIDDVVAYLPCAVSTFYEHFPKESELYKEILLLINDNKVKTKEKIRRKLLEGSKASELLAVYRLVCSPEERQMLNQNYIDITSKNKQIGNADLSHLSTEEIKKLIDGK